MLIGGIWTFENQRYSSNIKLAIHSKWVEMRFANFNSFL